MKTESDMIRLSDYVADLRSKLQHGRTRLKTMQGWLHLMEDADRDEIEVSLWKDALNDQVVYLATLTEQLHEYESLVGWR